jgi:hypothetical protein
MKNSLHNLKTPENGLNKILPIEQAIKGAQSLCLYCSNLPYLKEKAKKKKIRWHSNFQILIAKFDPFDPAVCPLCEKFRIWLKI